MPRKAGDKRGGLFDRLISEGVEERAAAVQAGYPPARVGEFLARRKKRNAERAAKAAAEAAQAPKDDRELAKVALRSQIALGGERTQISAAAELLRHSPESKQDNANRAIIVFRGRDDDAGARVVGVDPEAVAEAAKLAEEIRVHGRDEALAAFALTHAVDPAEWAQIQCALEVDSVSRAFKLALSAALSVDPALRGKLERARAQALS